MHRDPPGQRRAVAHEVSQQPERRVPGQRQLVVLALGVARGGREPDGRGAGRGRRRLAEVLDGLARVRDEEAQARHQRLQMVESSIRVAIEAFGAVARAPGGRFGRTKNGRGAWRAVTSAGAMQNSTGTQPSHSSAPTDAMIRSPVMRLRQEPDQRSEIQKFNF